MTLSTKPRSRLRPVPASVVARRFAPIDTVHKAEHQQNLASPLAGMPAECPECGKAFCGAAAVVDEPIYHVRTGKHTALIWLYCNHGGHLAVFSAYCNRDASRIDARAGDAVIIRPTSVKNIRIIEAFLAAHPEARGIEM